MPRIPAVLAALIVVSAIMACGDDDAPEESSPTPTVSSNETPAPTPTPSIVLSPPVEGPDRGPAATERTDFWTVPEWELPEYGDLPAAPEDDDSRIFSPPSEVDCPDDWVEVQRLSEGFSICHPADWQIAGDGYVNAGMEDRWYSHGIFNFTDEDRSQPAAHVSVYAIPRHARPMTYTRDCPRPYGIIFATREAVICPEFPEESPQEDFVSYHIRHSDYDYFVQAVPYEIGDDEAFDLAVQIAHTFQLIERSTP